MGRPSTSSATDVPSRAHPTALAPARAPAENDIDGIRRRPGMYIGDVHDGSGLAHMVWELLSNALDEHICGSCQTVSIVINDDGSVTIQDDGRGIPTYDLDGAPFFEKALTSLHRTPTLDGHAPHEHVGLHGIGLVAVNALSSWLEIEIFRDGKRYRQRYERGAPCGAADATHSTAGRGTTITFLPDPTIFSDPWLNPGTIAVRLRELACLVPSLTFSFADRRKQVFHEPRGLRVLLERTRSPRDRVLSVLAVDELVDDVSVEATMEWRGNQRSSIDSYANIHTTSDGGAHVRGLLSGLALGLRDAEGPRVGKRRLESLRGIVTRGLHAVVCVRLRDPTFESPTKSRLETPSVATAVSKVVRRAFGLELRDNLELRERLVRLLDGGPA